MPYNKERQVNDKIIIDSNGFFICPFCSEPFRALAYHTRQVHGIDARRLREMFNLPLNYSLQTEDLKELRRLKALENKMDLQLIKAGKKTRFKKGQFKEETRERIRKGHIIGIRKIQKIQ